MQDNSEYWHFAESERHFNTIQSGIRNLASGWMLAAFAAIAILLKTNTSSTWVVSPVVLIGVISLMASLGLMVLWINDQLVYQRLLDCSFIAGMKMEFDDRQIPPVRTLMTYSTQSKGMSRWMTLFYSIPLWFFLLITIVSFILSESIGTTGTGLGTISSLIIMFTICVIQLLIALWVQLKKKDVGSRVLASAFGDNEFTKLFMRPEYPRSHLTKVIEQYDPFELGHYDGRRIHAGHRIPKA